MTANLRPWLVSLLILAASAGWLLLDGRAPLAPSGRILLWYDDPWGPEGSQHLFDWYSPSHLIHGLIFYCALWLVARRLAIGWRLCIAVLVECAWELAENFGNGALAVKRRLPRGFGPSDACRTGRTGGGGALVGCAAMRWV